MDPTRWSFNSGNLTGPFVDKIAAMKEAGFTSATLWHSDLFPVFDDPDGAIQPFRNSGLRLSAYQFLRDMEGISDSARAHKLELARQLMDQLKLIGGDTLAIGSTMSPTEDRNWAKAVEAVQMFGELGKSLGVRVAYEPMCFSEWINDYRLAWKLIRDVDHSHVGLLLDSAHVFLPNLPLDGISEIRGDKIFLVELNDFPQTQLPIREMLRNYRLFPGEGVRPVGEFVDRVLATGYTGEFAVEVFNATYRSWDARVVAKRGFGAMEKLFATR
ncbi:MAG: sugar phosphate isomerase/epimerase [Alphaproteobacteria bacterium]|nr:sugar phosphate isomerase/epimerase [Alphaproteobacteria bacterium]